MAPCLDVFCVAIQTLDTFHRPPAPPDVSAVKGIHSSYSFLHVCVSRGDLLDVTGCLSSKLTVWKEDQFTVLPGQGVKEQEMWIVEWIVKELSKSKTVVWGCVKDRDLWSNEEEVHMRPGHRFGDAGNDTSCEKQFNLSHHYNHTWEDYRDTRFCKQDRTLVIKKWVTVTEWKRIRQDSRSKSGHQMLTHHGHPWQ